MTEQPTIREQIARIIIGPLSWTFMERASVMARWPSDRWLKLDAADARAVRAAYARADEILDVMVETVIGPMLQAIHLYNQAGAVAMVRQTDKAQALWDRADEIDAQVRKTLEGIDHASN